MKSSAATYWVVLVALLCGVYGTFLLWRNARNTDTPQGTPVAVATKTASSPTGKSANLDGPVLPFKLTDQDGNEFDSSQLEGKVWVASFFFTNCPAICWRMNQALAAWQHLNPDSDIHFVSITCDPENDTPEALKKYAEHFKADPKRWTFLTGDMSEIQKIGQESFHIAVVKGDHTDRACVVDRNGKIRGRFRLTEPDQAELLDRLLMVVEAESPPAKVAAESTTTEKTAETAGAAEVSPAEPNEAASSDEPATTPAAAN